MRSAIVLIVSLLVFLFSPVSAQNPGFKTVISQAALDYITEVGVEILLSQLDTISVPDISGKSKVPVIGDIEYDLKEIVIQSLQLPTNKLNLDPKIRGVSGSMQDVSAYVTLKWHYKVEMWPNPSDSGSAKISISQTTVGVVVSVEDNLTRGTVTVNTSDPEVAIGKFDITLSGGASWLYNFFIGLFQSNIKNAVESSLSSAIKQNINDNANKALATLPVIEKVNGNLEIDYAMVQSILYTSDYMTTAHRGEFYDPKDKRTSPGTPSAMPNSVDDTRQLQILLSEYSANSALYVFQQENLVQGVITEADLPPNSPLRLNSSDLAWLILAPGIPKSFPNMAMQLLVEASEDPLVTMTTEGGAVNATGNLTVQVIQPNGTLFNAFTLVGTAFCQANATVVQQNVSVELIYLGANVSLESSQVGTVLMSMINTLMGQLGKFVVPMLNKKLEPGFPIPSIDGVSFVDPEVSWNDGFMMVATDFKYKPSE